MAYHESHMERQTSGQLFPMDSTMLLEQFPTVELNILDEITGIHTKSKEDY